MPLNFVKYMDDELKSIGYETSFEETKPTHAYMRFKPRTAAMYAGGGKSFSLYYIRKPIEGEWIREAFTLLKHPVLFVIDAQLLAEMKTNIVLKKALPLWFRALHAIYYGRVYAWFDTGKGIQAFHVNWEKWEFTYSETIVIDKMIFTETDCKLRDFPGTFQIARFTDDAFWKRDPNAPKKPPKQKPNYQTYEDFAKQQWGQYQQSGFWQERSSEDYYGDAGYSSARGYPPPPHQNRSHYYSAGGNPPPKDGPREGESFENYFKRIFEEDLRRRNQYNPPPPPPGSRRRSAYQVDDQWLAKMLAAGNLDGAKKVYRDLARQYHPDQSKEANATEIMQAINNAYDKAKSILK